MDHEAMDHGDETSGIAMDDLQFQTLLSNATEATIAGPSYCSPFLSTSPFIRHPPTIALRSDWRTYFAFTVAFIVLGSNSVIIYLNFKPLHLEINLSPWWLSFIYSGNAIAIIGIIVKLLDTATILLGSWAIAQSWSRKLCHDRNGAGLAEFQSLGLFHSLVSALRTVAYLFQRHFSTADFPFVALLILALLLQLYPAALQTLLVPTISPKVDEVTYHFSSRPYMAYSVVASDCAVYTQQPEDLNNCMGLLLTGNSLGDVLAFYGESFNFRNSTPWQGDNDSLVPDDSFDGFQTTAPIRSQVSLNIPMGFDPDTGGGIMYGHNYATIDASLAAIQDNNAVLETLDVNTTVPLLSSHCVVLPQSPNISISSVSLGSTSYQLTYPVPLLQAGQLVGQVSQDGVYLIFSFLSGALLGSSSNVHCIIELRFADITLELTGLSWPERHLLANLTNAPPLSSAYSATTTNQNLVTNFYDLWLAGSGFSGGIPQNNTAISSLLSGLPLVVSTGMSNASSLPPFLVAEYHTLAMLATASSLAVSIETSSSNLATPLDSTYPPSNANRIVARETEQYFIGARTPAHYTCVGIVALDSVFVVYCLYVILGFSGAKHYGAPLGRRKLGWLPDFTDAAFALCSGLSSPATIEECKGAGSERDLKRDVWRVRLVGGVDPSDGQFLVARRGSILRPAPSFHNWNR